MPGQRAGGVHNPSADGTVEERRRFSVAEVASRRQGRRVAAASVPGVEHQWRSGLGVTADGALVYAVGPALDPLQLALLLALAGVVRGMELDINRTYARDFIAMSARPVPGGRT